MIECHNLRNVSRKKRTRVFPGGAVFSWVGHTAAECLTSKQLVWECGFHCSTTTNYELQCLLLALLAVLKSKAFFKTKKGKIPCTQKHIWWCRLESVSQDAFVFKSLFGTGSETVNWGSLAKMTADMSRAVVTKSDKYFGVRQYHN